jgi:uncharacterized protein (TIGR03435 family)
MRRAIVVAGLACLFLVAPDAVRGQAPPKLEFEVASVKPAAPGQIGFTTRGGPGTSDPGRITFVNTPLQRIFLRAYGITAYEMAGPSWMETAKYDIVAKIPQGATTEQLAIMLQNLLSERFRLTLHQETRQIPVYELVIGRSGSKLKESDLSASTPSAPDGPLKAGKDGFPEPPPGRPTIVRYTVGGSERMVGRQQTLDQIAQMLGGYAGNHVVNKTGLTGEYDFTLQFASNDSPADQEFAPSLFTAVQEQLGLRLDKAKGSVDVLVIDNLDRVPTAN